MERDTKIRRIAVDCRMIKNSGIGVYLKNILHFWLAESNCKFLLIGNEKAIKKEFAAFANFEVLPCEIPIFSLKEKLRFPTKEINRCDAFYSPNFNLPFGIKVPVFMTLHDVVFLDYKDFTSSFGRFIRRQFLNIAVRRAEHIFTVSEFTKQRILHYFPKQNNITVAYNGINSSLINYKSGICKKRFDFPYAIYVGNIKRHKGLDVLVEAWESLDKKLVIVGDVAGLKSADEATFRRMQANENIILAGRIASDEELYSLIENAELLVQPSRYEGFGIPPLEALWLGTKVVLSDIPVFREVYGDLPVRFFEAENPQSLLSAISNPNTDSVPQKVLAERFSYQSTARTILQSIVSR